MTSGWTKAGILAAVLWIAHDVVHASQIELVGLFGNKAVITIDGTRHILAVDDTSPEGVKLIAVDGDQVTLERDGKRSTHTLGQSGSISSTYSAPSTAEVAIAPDVVGMYRTHGSINGVSVRFLVDTGATVIAVNGSQARRMGIDFKRVGQPVPMGTANGTVIAYLVKLDRVKVGGIELFGVEAAVIDSNGMDEVLLGMSFLGRLQIQRDGSLLRLRKK